MLTQQLRELEHEGIISRRIYNENPPKVEYSLTDYGKSLKRILEDLTIWGEHHMERESGDEINFVNIEREKY